MRRLGLFMGLVNKLTFGGAPPPPPVNARITRTGQIRITRSGATRIVR